MVGIFAHDFDGDQRGRRDLLPGISAVGEDALNEWEDAPRDSQKRSAAVAILDARRMRFEHEATPVGVDERMALTSGPAMRRESDLVLRRPIRAKGLSCITRLAISSALRHVRAMQALPISIYNTAEGVRAILRLRSVQIVRRNACGYPFCR